MLEWFVTYFEAMMMIAPIIILLLSYGIIKLLLKHKWRVIHLTVQLTAPFLVIATTYLVMHLYDFSIFYYAIIFFLVLVMLHLIVQWKRDTEVILRKGIKLALRILFLIFLPAYLGFGLYYLYQLLV